MTKLEKIQSAITDLSRRDLSRLRRWLADLDAQLFDEKLERDARSGKLDRLAAKALADDKAGRTRDL